MNVTVGHLLGVEQTAELAEIVSHYLKTAERKLLFIPKGQASDSAKKVDPTVLALYVVYQLQSMELSPEDVEGFSQDIEAIKSIYANLQGHTQFFVNPPNTTIN